MFTIKDFCHRFIDNNKKNDEYIEYRKFVICSCLWCAQRFTEKNAEILQFDKTYTKITPNQK